MIWYLKRYGISLLPKNFFKGGSFYNKGRGGDREGRGGVGRGGRGEIKKKVKFIHWKPLSQKYFD